MPSTFITSNTLIQRFADALFGVQVGSVTLAQVTVDTGNTGIVGLKSVFNSYYTQSFGGMTSAQVADMMLVNLGIAVGKSGLVAADVKVARDYIISNLNSTPSGQRGDTVSTILSLFSGMTADATFGAAATAFNGQIASSEVWGANNSNNVALGTANVVVLNLNLGVGVDNLFGSAGNDTFVAKVVQNANGQQVNTLGSGDVLIGNGGNDTLSAKITAGAYVNSSTAGSQYQGLTQVNATMPIQPETRGIQTVKLQAVNSSISGSNMVDGKGNGAASTEVFVNAKDMADVTVLASDNSDANLTIQNMTTLNADGSRHALNTDRIGMAFSGNSDSGWKESDLHVYFDQDYLTPQVNTSSSVDIRVMNQDAYDTTNSQATALGITTSTAAIGPTYLYQFLIKLNGKNYDLAPFLTVAANPINALINYTGELAAIQAAIAKLKLVPANLTDAALQTLTATIGANFTADAPVDPVTGVVSVVARVGQSVTLAVSSGVLTVEQLLLAPVSQTNANMNLFNRALATTVTATNLAINVDLTKVGNWGDGGSLVIGSMYKDGLNTYTPQYAGKGINQFDVVLNGTKTVNGDDMSSSLKQLASTGNNLRVVTVKTSADVTANFANLTIGNSQTEDAFGVLTKLSATPSAANLNALKDVQTFDASGLKGNLNLFAGLSSEVTLKYLNVVDTAAPAADNVAFVYTGGIGNDSINLYLDAANLDKPGTATREDMTLVVNGGAGDDAITVKIGDSTNLGAIAVAAVAAVPGVLFNNTLGINKTFADIGGLTGTTETGTVQNWYANQKINANLVLSGGVATGQLQLNGGDGNDTIRKMGSGDFAINGGTGNNTIYADNTGTDGNTFNSGRAVDVFNAKLNTSGTNGAGVYDPTNLLSDKTSLAVAANTVVNVKVSILGFEKTIAVANPTTATVITDLMINQAVKTLINGDQVLSKLVAVADGPARTLVLNWLIDGNMNIDPTTGLAIDGVAAGSLRDLTISLSSTSGVTTTAFDTAFGTTNGIYANHAGTDAFGKVIMAGQNSINPSDNLIDANTNAVAGGIDVIVLGTAGFHQGGNQILGSNDTIAYQGFGGVADTVVNFDTTMAAPAGIREVANVTFTAVAAGSNAGAQTIVFDGATTTLSAPVVGDLNQGVKPAADVAFQFVQQYNGAANTSWTAALDTATAGKVVLTRNAGGVTTDLVAANFTGTYFGGTNTGSVGTPNTTTQGTDNGASSSTVVVSLDTAGTAALAAGNFKFNGTTINYAQGDGSVTLAKLISAATYTDYIAALTTATTVTLTAKVIGATAVPVSGTDFIGIDPTATDGIVGSVSNVLGAPIGSLVQGQGFDYLDFTSYKVNSAQVHLVGAVGTAVATAVASNAGFGSLNYLDLAESTTNAGFYTVTVRASADKSLIGTVGTIDFGHTEAFVAQNFII